jgi:hypothetical protein
MSYRTTRRILVAYESWATECGLVPEGQAARQWRTRIEILLNARADYLEKRDPTYWRSGDVHELLVQYCAPRQVDAWDLTTYAPAAVRDFLRFLDETGRLHPGSTRAGTLLKELDRLTPKFAAAMADTSSSRQAKRVFSAMIADDVDLADESAVDRWAEKFSTLEASARRSVLGELIDEEPRLGTALLVIHDGQTAFLRPGQVACKHLVWPDARCVCGECDDLGDYPAIELPAEDELAGAVTDYGSGLLRSLLAFAAWIGERGQPVDKHGNLLRDAVREAAAHFGLSPTGVSRLAELPGLHRLWRLSLEFGILELRHTRVVTGPDRDLADRVLRGEASPDEALALWRGLFGEVSDPVRPDADGPDKAIGEWLAFWPPHFFDHLCLQSAHGEFVSFAETMRDIVCAQADRIPPDQEEAFIEMAASVVRMALSYVAEHGGVEVSGGELPVPLSDDSAAALRTLGLEPWGFFPSTTLKVRLTDLGLYAMREQLL